MRNSKVYNKKFIHVGFTSMFIAMAVGLLLQTHGLQWISSAKAAQQTIPASDLSVVGQPSLPAATVETIFKSLGSPMSGTGQVVVQASHQTNVDDAFALAVWWTETNDGAAGVGLADRNPGSVRGSIGYPSAFDGYTIYPSYSAAIVYWFNMLKNNYVNRGLSTVYPISYPYVGTSGSPVWAGKVVALMLKYRGEAPPVPVVIPHGKRVTEPTVYRQSTATPLVHQALSQPRKTLTKHLSYVAKQANTSSPVLPSSYEYVIVFFALLLALAIVAGVLWLDKKRPIRDMRGWDSLGEDEQGEIIRGEGKQGRGKQGVDEQGGGKPRPYFTNERAYISDIVGAGLAPALTEPAPALTEPATPPFNAVLSPNKGANFRIHRTILLPSIATPEAASPDESPAERGRRGRSTGLLSLYGETHQ